MKALAPLALIFLYPVSASAAAPAGKPDGEKFAGEIEAFERADGDRPPPVGGILFIGSSSFRLWKTLAEDMSPLPVLNRGFGGSRTRDVLDCMDRIVLPARPRVIAYTHDSYQPGNGAFRILSMTFLVIRRTRSSGPLGET